MTNLRLAGFTPESAVDGPGLRVAIFLQGCHMACPHCHNPESWDIHGGQAYTPQQVIRMMKKRNPASNGPNRTGVQGVTFSGGEPFLQAAGLVLVAQAAHAMGWDVTVFTGYHYEDLLARNDPPTQALLDLTHLLVDGPYIHALRDLNLQFRGSSNQRAIDMVATRHSGHVVLY